METQTQVLKIGDRVIIENLVYRTASYGRVKAIDNVNGMAEIYLPDAFDGFGMSAEYPIDRIDYLPKQGWTKFV